MLFSSTLFLFLFLPIVLIGNSLLPARLRNAWLLLGSLVFYGWGEPIVVSVMLLSVLVNWGLGLWIAQRRTDRLPLLATLAFNLGMLVVFKYSDWIVFTASDLLMRLGVRDWPLPLLSDLWPRDSILHPLLFETNSRTRLPIGISFFTFQAMSYVIDVRRGEVAPQRNPFDLALYISLFPQLIAGPIVRYVDVAEEISKRTVTVDGFAYGIRRFVLGLGKKMLIANTAAECADAIFAIPVQDLPPGAAWLGIFCYTIQIYFDFSGYSDMAIGLGHMLGFRFLENFQYPYVARSITEFWRRWHISLSSWFRDYLYIPLGGNRAGRLRTYANLILVFALCGLWHGASFSFLAWGLFHGMFLVVERSGVRSLLDRLPRPFQHLYVLLVVMVGWVFFRVGDIGQAVAYLKAMAFLSEGKPEVWYVAQWLEQPLVLVLAIAPIAATPFLPALEARLDDHLRGDSIASAVALRLLGTSVLFAILLVSTLRMAAGTYNPFIYFRF